MEVLRVIPPGADTIATINAYLRIRRTLLSSSAQQAGVVHKIDEMLDAILAHNPTALEHIFTDK